MATPYDLVLAKHDRAKKHIDDFKKAVDLFWQTNQCTTRIEVDDRSGQVSYYVTSVPEIPLECRLILGDAFQNLRSALDHAIYFLVKRCGGKATSQTSFPIFDSPEEYEAGFARKVPGVGQVAKQEIDRLQPYKGGHNTLWTLHRLNIPDKHRLLLTVCCVNFGRSMTPSEKDQFVQKHGTDKAYVRYQFGQVIGATVEPLHVGKKLLTIPASDAQEDMRFLYEVALNEPSCSKGTPLSLLLSFMSMDVGLCIAGLQPYLT